MAGKSNHISGLFTDLYELTMAAGYFSEKMFAPATFSLFIRKRPKNWGYFVCSGLDDVLDFLEHLRFTDPDIEFLQGTGLFSGEFLTYLSGLRFSGDVRAMLEGEVFFAGEPILEVTAPIIESQIVETYLINAMHLQSMICTKASRCITAAAGRPLIDFSLRRTHGADAGMKVARSSYIAGFAATSNVLAGQCYGIPISGTMAHSYVTAFDDEIASFRAFARVHGDNTVLLIDTYDTLSGARKACEVGREMKLSGHRLRGVRLDSGDMAALSRQVRAILDEAGLEDTMIFASSGFDEYKIADALAGGALIDGFGVGTNMGVSKDAPSVDMAYKLVEYDGRPVLKLSAEKVNLPDAKQVFRAFGGDGCLDRDMIGLREEDVPPEYRPLLVGVMKGGERIFNEGLEEARKRCSASMKRLPRNIARIVDPADYELTESQRLTQENSEVQQRAKGQIESQ
jgi:nicotinate phosphoribosyltransferase